MCDGLEIGKRLAGWNGQVPGQDNLPRKRCALNLEPVILPALNFQKSRELAPVSGNVYQKSHPIDPSFRK